MKEITLRSLLLGIILAFTTGLCAQQYKVVEKSSKKIPGWYETAESGYLVASAEEATMEEARLKCLESIKLQIIQSVAQNIEFSDKTMTKQTTGNHDEILEFVQTYMAEGSTHAASLPFLKGISLSKVQDSYWEKRQDKKNKTVKYAYAVRYPFSKGELTRLIRDFEEKDKQVVSELTTLENRLNQVETVDEIDQAVIRLRPVVEYFFDKNRKQKAESILQAYRKLYTYITLEGKDSGNNTYTVWLKLQGRNISTSVHPVLKSNCAGQLKATVGSQNTVISYDNIDCLKDEENFIEVNYRLPGKQLKHKFYIEGRQ